MPDIRFRYSLKVMAADDKSHDNIVCMCSTGCKAEFQNSDDKVDHAPKSQLPPDQTCLPGALKVVFACSAKQFNTP